MVREMFFLQELIIQLDIENFDVKNAKVKIDKFIGLIPDDYSTGGYLDIEIESRGKKIIIENKIDSWDGQNQLVRYHTQNPIGLYYLTLDGRLATANSTGENLKCPDHYKCLSYAKDIIDWLEKCKKHATASPLLRETLTQYIYLLKDLTHQSKSKRMSDEIVALISGNIKFLEAAEEIYKNWKVITKAVTESLVKEIADEIGLAFEVKEWGLEFWFYREPRKDRQIYFEWSGQKLKYGLCVNESWCHIEENGSWDTHEPHPTSTTDIAGVSTWTEGVSNKDFREEYKKKVTEAVRSQIAEIHKKDKQF